MSRSTLVPSVLQTSRVDEFLDVDVSDWPQGGVEQMGTKPKRWLREPTTDQPWLWKEATRNQKPGDGDWYLKGDDWAEKVASYVGASLGIPVPSVELAHMGSQPGVISLDFTERTAALVHGNELLAGADPKYDSAQIRGNPRYTVDSVFRVLEPVQLPQMDEAIKTAPEWFAGYLVLDALVGNTDRHHDNWGVLREGGKEVLAPSFDHASSLGFLISDEERRRLLDENFLAGWANKARTPFAKRPHPVAVALATLGKIGGEVSSAWLGCLEKGVADGVAAIRAVPETRMTVDAKRFAEGILRHNLEMLMSEGPSMIV